MSISNERSYNVQDVGSACSKTINGSRAGVFRRWHVDGAKKKYTRNGKENVMRIKRWKIATCQLAPELKCMHSRPITFRDPMTEGTMHAEVEMFRTCNENNVACPNRVVKLYETKEVIDE